MIYWDDPESISILKNLLNKDEVVLASGDTVLGLWGQPTQMTFERLNFIKQRSEKPYLMVIAAADKLSLFTDQLLSEKLQALIKTCWPGPVTLIFKAKTDLAPWLKNSNGTIALRVPDHEGLQKLLLYYDGLFSTSANMHTKPIPDTIGQVDPFVLEHVGEVCLERGQEEYEQNPSTILDCSNGDIKVLRLGVFDFDLIQSLIE